MKNAAFSAGLLLCMASVAGTPTMTFPYGAEMSVRHQTDGSVEINDFYQVPSVGDGMPKSDTVATTHFEMIDLQEVPAWKWSSENACAEGGQAALCLKSNGDGSCVWMGYSNGAWIELEGAEPKPGVWAVKMDLDYTRGETLVGVRYSVRPGDSADDYVPLHPLGSVSPWVAGGNASARRVSSVELYGNSSLSSAQAESGQRQGYAEASAVEDYRMDYSGVALDVALGETWGVDTLVATVKDSSGHTKGEVRAALSDAVDGKVRLDLSDYMKSGEGYVYDFKLTGEYNGTPITCEMGGANVELFSMVDWFGFGNASLVKASTEGLSVASGTLVATDPNAKGVVIPSEGETESSPTKVDATLSVPGAIAYWDLPAVSVSGLQGALVMARFGGSVGRSWAVWSATANDWVAVSGAGVGTENGSYEIRAEFDGILSVRSVRYSVKVGSDYVVLKDGQANEWFALPATATRLNRVALSGAGGISSLDASYKALGPVPEVTVKDGKIELTSNAELDLAKSTLETDRGYAVQAPEGKRYHLRWTDAKSGNATTKWAKTENGQLKVVAGAPANGMESYTSHVLGLDPSDEASVPRVASVQNANPHDLEVAVQNIDPRGPDETGVYVSYSLVTASDPDFGGQQETLATSDEPRFSTDLTKMKGNVQYYRADIRLSYKPFDPLAPKIAPVKDNVFTGVSRVLTSETDGFSVKLEGDRLYYGAGHTVYVYDVTTPDDPQLLGSCSGIGNVRQLAVENGIVYVSTRETGMWIVDATDPTAPTIVTRYDAVELGTGIDVRGGLVMLGQRQNGVEFIDVRDPAHPQHIRIEKTNESQSTLYWKGVCYSGEWGGGLLTAISAADMSQVQILQTLNVHGYGDGLDAYGDRLYISTGHHYRHEVDGEWVADSDEGSDGYGRGHAVEIVDISNPQSPQLLGRCEFDRFYRSGMDMWSPRASGEGRYVFCADTYNGLYAVDAQDPANPEIVGHLTVPYADGSDTALSHPVTGVEVGDGVVYMTVSGAGLVVAACPVAHRRIGDGAADPGNLDYRYPYNKTYANLSSVWKPSVRGQVRSVAACGSTHLYVAAGHAGLSVLNSGFAELKRLDVPFCGDVKVRGTRLYSAEGRNGLAVYDITDPGNPTLLRRDTTFGGEIQSGCVIWLMAPAGSSYLALSEHGSDGYGFYIDEDSGLSTRRQRVSTSVGWDKYLSDEIINNMFAVNTRGKVSWVDLSGKGGRTPTVQKVDGSFSAKLNTGVCAYSNGRFLFAGSRAFYYLAAGETSLSSATSGSLPSGVAGGQVVWDGSLNVGMAERIEKRISLFDMSSEKSPRRTFVESVEGLPDRPIFFNGKFVVPCGYDGVLVQK